jgi:hypothetical protein
LTDRVQELREQVDETLDELVERDSDTVCQEI